jgi:hypothetical protein
MDALCDDLMKFDTALLSDSTLGGLGASPLIPSAICPINALLTILGVQLQLVSFSASLPQLCVNMGGVLKRTGDFASPHTLKWIR